MLFSIFGPEQLPRREDGAIAGVLATATFVVLTGVLLTFFVFGKIVPPNYIGVRQNYFWPERGYKEKGLEPGLHWKIPGISTVILIPRDFQFVDFKSEDKHGQLNLPELSVPAADGPIVRSDISLILRFYSQKSDKQSKTVEPKIKSNKPWGASSPQVDVPLAEEVSGSHGGPRELLTNFTDDPDRQLKTFAHIAENELRKTLSQLNATEYYNPVLRENAALAANREINAIVNPNGIEVWAALVRRYIYEQRIIDDQIFAKNLQDQTEQLNIVKSALAQVRALTEQERALGDANIRSLQIDGESQSKVLRSEGELLESKKIADGDLLVASAKAKIDGLRASALSDVQGAEIYVAREMVPLVETLSGGVVSGIDPYDINQWVNKLTPK